MQRVSILLLLTCISPIANSYDSVDDTRSWAVIGVNVIEVETGEVEPGRAIVIDGGLITSVIPVSDLDPDSIDLVVDLSGQYVIPGLWDMHVHLRGGPEFIDVNERWLRQYLAFGVTTVRDAGGDLPNSVLHWRDEIEQGQLTGPHIYSALRKIDGSFGQPGAIPVESKTDVDTALDYLVLAEADFVKIYDTSLPQDLYLRSVREAEARNLKTSAHLPPWVSFERAVDAGLDSIEHAIYIAKAGDPHDRRTADSLDPEDLIEYVDYYRAIANVGSRTRKDTLQENFELMVSRSTGIVTTLSIEQLYLSYLDGRAPTNPRRAETPEPILATHEETLDFLRGQVDEISSDQRQIVQQTEGFLKAAVDAGVTILAGTDTGANNPLLYPGDSMHAELESLVDIGISPLNALRSATLNAARWMGVYPAYGSISSGSAADLVILEANPLQDIANTRTISAVIQQGVYYDTHELAELKILESD